MGPCTGWRWKGAPICRRSTLRDRTQQEIWPRRGWAHVDTVETGVDRGTHGGDLPAYGRPIILAGRRPVESVAEEMPARPPAAAPPRNSAWPSFQLKPRQLEHGGIRTYALLACVALRLPVLRDQSLIALTPRLSRSRSASGVGHRLLGSATRRFSRAADLLEAGQPIKEVARPCGFCSAPQFIHAFHRVHGATPGR